MWCSFSFSFTCWTTDSGAAWFHLTAFGSSFAPGASRWSGKNSMTFPPACSVFSIASKTLNWLNVHAWQPSAKPLILQSSGIFDGGGPAFRPPSSAARTLGTLKPPTHAQHPHRRRRRAPTQDGPAAQVQLVTWIAPPENGFAKRGSPNVRKSVSRRMTR